MHFLAPIWFLSAAAVAIPILIHLWNNRKGKTLSVGSTAFLERAAEEKSWQRKLTDPLLLVLRCLLLVLLSALLAQPFFPGKGNAGEHKGWVLAPKNEFAQTYRHFSQPIDSLLKNGFELRYFEPGFAGTTPEAALRDSSRQAIVENTSYWALAQAAQQAVADSVPIYIFTDNRLAHFFGTRPVATRKLVWQTYSASADSSQQSLKANSTSTDTATLSVVIVTDGNAGDGNYIRAALTAIADFEKKKINIALAAAEAKTIPRVDWVFWLNTNPPPSDLNCRNLLLYETGNVETVSSWISTRDETKMMDEPALLYKVAGIDHETGTSEMLWKDGFGRGILTMEKIKAQNRFHFYSRFDPDWNGLVWSAEFPAALKSLLEFEKEGNHDVESRGQTLDPLQVKLEPGKAAFVGLIQSGSQPVNSAAIYIWALVFLVFIIERVISYLKQNKGEHGQ